jgi:aspartyl-tRNA(Asn)/glutamyl-tRNA(Gln) amidotransferase subunit A
MRCPTRGLTQNAISSKTNSNLNRITVGILSESSLETCDSEIIRYIMNAVRLLERLGVTTRVVSPPPYTLGKACAYAILHCEAASLHQESLARTPHLYGRKLRALLKAAEKIPATTYVRALRVRRVLMREYDKLFMGIDVLIVPTKATTASRSSERDSPQAHRRGGLFTGVFNVIGYPAISLPCGFSSKGLPIGMQIVGRPFEESTIFKVALAYEAKTDWHRRRPPI